MAELPKRKRLRLPEYDFSRNGVYFVTVCTKGRRCILGSIVGADVLIGLHMELSECGKIVESCILQMPSVEQYAVMPNHIHLLIRTEDGPVRTEDGPVRTPAPTETDRTTIRSAQKLPTIIRWLKRETTRRCGFPLWQRSYYDHIIRDENDVLRVWNYIDANPAQWAEDCDYEESAL